MRISSIPTLSRRFNINNIIEITITSLGGLGDGIGNFKDKPVFVEKSVEGDVLRVRIISETKESIRGEIIEIIKGGEKRRQAPCPHFSACGGCSLQQIEESSYRKFKTRIAENALKQAGFSDTEAKSFFLPPASRRRAEFKIFYSSEAKKYRLAYLESRSHNKTTINNCLILEEKLQKIIPLLSEQLQNLSFAQNLEAVSLTSVSGGTEIIFKLAENTVISATTESIKSELNNILQKLDVTRAIFANENSKPLVVAESKKLCIRIGAIDMPLPFDAFLQASEEGQKILSEFAVRTMSGNKKILDLFCGIGTYSIGLAEFAETHAADNHKLMINNLKQAAKTHNLSLVAEERNLFAAPYKSSELKKFTGVVINPPRAGSKAQCEQIAASGIKYVTIISCNPATFARDAKILGQAGFTLKEAIAVDQFVFSPHLELAAYFVRT